MFDDLTVVQSAIWKAPFETGIAAYKLHNPDTLHLYWQGLARTFLQDLQDTLVIIKTLGGEEAVCALDFWAMLQRPVAWAAASC